MLTPPQSISSSDFFAALLKRPRTPPTNAPTVDYQSGDSEHLMKRSRPGGQAVEDVKMVWPSVWSSLGIRPSKASLWIILVGVRQFAGFLVFLFQSGRWKFLTRVIGALCSKFIMLVVVVVVRVILRTLTLLMTFLRLSHEPLTKALASWAWTSIPCSRRYCLVRYSNWIFLSFNMGSLLIGSCGKCV